MTDCTALGQNHCLPRQMGANFSIYVESRETTTGNLTDLNTKDN